MVGGVRGSREEQIVNLNDLEVYMSLLGREDNQTHEAAEPDKVQGDHNRGCRTSDPGERRSPALHGQPLQECLSGKGCHLWCPGPHPVPEGQEGYTTVHPSDCAKEPPQERSTGSDQLPTGVAGGCPG